MSLIIGDNFSYQGQKPLDTRLITQSLTTLLAVPSYTIYNGIQVYVESEKKYYVYDSNNTIDPTLDKWRELTSNGSSNISEVLKYSKAFTSAVNTDETISFADLSGVNAITDIKVNQLLNDVAGIIAKVVSINTSTNEVQVRILSKDTIMKQDVVQYNDVLDAEINKIQTADYTKLVTTEAIADFSINNLIYGTNGTLAKVLSKDEVNNTLSVVPVSLSVAIGSNDVYLTSEKINPKINSQTTLNFANFVTSKTINDIEKTQLVYDMDGTLARIDLINISNIVGVADEVIVTTVSTSSDQSVKTYKYLGTNLSKVPDFKSSINYSDLDTTQLLNNIKVNELIYDKDGTLAKIIMIDIPNSQLLVQTLTASGMPYAPVLKELVIKDGGAGYTVGKIINSDDPTIFGKITEVDSNGAITGIVIDSTATSANATGTKQAVINYETVIYGATGNNWTKLSNASSMTAQIVSESFTYESGFNYEITNGGSNYKVGDIVKIGTNIVEVTKVNAGVVEEVVWSRELSPSTIGTGLTLVVTSSNDSFIIPTDVWNSSNRNSFDLTNNDGANVEFNRLDGVNQKCAAGDGSIYKFTFDSKNGVIYQEKTEIDSNGGGIGPFIPFKNYKKNDVIINDNIIFICKDDYTASATLGDDIVYWTEMRKQMTSGMRSIKTQIISQPSSSVLRATKADYVDGDASMYDATNCKYIAPIDGLYLMQIDGYTLPNNNTQRRETAIFRDILNWDNAASISSGVINLGISAFYVGYLKAGESLIPGHYSVTNSTIDVTAHKAYIMFVLLTDDRSDNLVAEADLIMPTSISARTYTTLTYENTSNLGIISTNGIITLPEDGSYMLSIDNLISSTGGTSGGLETILTIKDGTAVDALTTITHASCTKLQSAGFTHIITGSKGDTFEIKTYRTETQSNLTKSYDQKIRLFKIKSVDYHIDSHDLYKDSGSTLDYEDWVKSKLTNQQLTVKTTIDKSQTLNKSFMKYIYASGELSMFQDNKFIAPISGYYTFQLSPVVLNSSVSHSFALEKNPTVSSWKKDALAWAPMVNANNANPGLNWFGWLNKDDYLMVDYYGSNNLTIDPQSETTATLTLVSTGLSSMSQYTADKPHLWPDNQEVDLGDGLYGYKAVGEITASANAEKDTIIPITGDITLVNWNSWFKHSNGSNYWLSGTAKSYSCTLFKADKVYYRTKATSARTNLPYSVWLTYTKGGIN